MSKTRFLSGKIIFRFCTFSAREHIYFCSALVKLLPFSKNVFCTILIGDPKANLNEVIVLPSETIVLKEALFLSSYSLNNLVHLGNFNMSSPA